MGASWTRGASKRSSAPPPDWTTRAGWYSNHTWLAATLRVWRGRTFPSKRWNDCHPSQENSWLSDIATNGQRAVVRERDGDVEPPGLLAIRVAEDLAQAPVVAVPVRLVLGVVHDLVDEIAQVQHERELVLGRRVLVLEDHAAVRVLRAFDDVLAAHEREGQRPRVVVRGRGPRAADAAAVAFSVREAIEVRRCRAQASHQHAARVVRGGERLRLCRRHDALESR